MFSADILAEGVSGLVPKPFGIAKEKEKTSDDISSSLYIWVLLLILQRRVHSMQNQLSHYEYRDIISKFNHSPNYI
jgi:hypothetical protein